MSTVNGKKIVGYNLRTKQEEQAMHVDEIRKYDTKTAGKYRYILLGTDAKTGDKMAVTAGKDMADAASDQLGIKITKGVPKPKKVSAKKSATCKVVAKRAEAACEEKKAIRKLASIEAAEKRIALMRHVKSVVKKSPAKKKTVTKKAKKEQVTVTVEIPEERPVSVAKKTKALPKPPKKKASTTKKPAARKITKKVAKK